MDKHRLLWASRRGMLELDLILQPFVEHIYPTIAPEDQLLYQQLLDCEDQDLFVWFLRRQEPEDEGLRRIVRIIRETREQLR